MRRELVGELLSQRGVPEDRRGKCVHELGDHPVVIHSIMPSPGACGRQQGHVARWVGQDECDEDRAQLTSLKGQQKPWALATPESLSSPRIKAKAPDLPSGTRYRAHWL